MAEIVSIKEQIRFLAQMQVIDGKIHGLRRENEQALEEENKNLAKRRKEKEIDLGSKEENIKKLNSQLPSLKTNKEYHAMLSEITSFKTDISVLEEDILKIMDEQDALKGKLAKEKAYLAGEDKKFQEEKKKIDEHVKEIECAISDLTAKRNQITPSIDKRIYAIYERILKGKDGLALVAVKDYSCQGCYIGVTSQVVNEIKMYDKIVTCESCARILYLEEEL
jgi:uncharacterized protein